MRAYPRYQRRSYYRRYPSNLRTRYYSTRRYPGMYRLASRTVYPRRIGNVTRSQIQRVVRGLAERKYFETIEVYTGGDAVDWNGTIEVLTLLPQGTTDHSRIGDKCTGTSLEFMWDFKPSLTNYTTIKAQIMLRIILFIWKDEVVPTPGDLLHLAVVGGTDMAPLAPFHHDKRIARKILWDSGPMPFFFSVQSQIVWQMARAGKQVINLVNRGKDRVINFWGGTSATATNHIYACYITNADQSVSNTTWQLNAYSRYNFQDL